uniref:Uncharacterized protein n=1 Tax=Sphaerodactylus townsendi TaxID=933632 RepID=A0ACB8FUH3_9SAUR
MLATAMEGHSSLLLTDSPFHGGADIGKPVNVKMQPSTNDYEEEQLSIRKRNPGNIFSVSWSGSLSVLFKRRVQLAESHPDSFSGLAHEKTAQSPFSVATLQKEIMLVCAGDQVSQELWLAATIISSFADTRHEIWKDSLCIVGVLADKHSSDLAHWLVAF